jgi:hypothetical protein
MRNRSPDRGRSRGDVVPHVPNPGERDEKVIGIAISVKVGQEMGRRPERESKQSTPALPSGLYPRYRSICPVMGDAGCRLRIPDLKLEGLLPDREVAVGECASR